MAKCYHTIEPIFKDTHLSMVCDQVASANTLIESLSSAEIIILDTIIKILHIVDTFIMFLRKSTTSMI